MNPIIMITRKMVIVPAINTLLFFLNFTRSVSIIVTSMAVKVVKFNFNCNTKIALKIADVNNETGYDSFLLSDFIG